MDAMAKGLRIAALMALLLVAACARSTPETRLRATLSELQQAVDARDAAGVRGVLADDFIGPDGLDKAGAARLAQLMFLRYRSVGAHAGPLDVRVQGAAASVSCDVVLTGGDAGALPEAGQLYAVTTGWRLEGGEWRLASAGWKAAGDR
ncbi:MAG TPA: nuclear transport factor 2 family protein [Xanthomonadaceae bacterium]|nr:nuclear transport factor 2 family protein [Xanthomonadaceae bacterium]